MLPDGQAWAAMQDWLIANHGMFLLEIHLNARQQWNPVPQIAFCIFMGKTASGVKHAVVGACNGQNFAVVHNPDPDAELDGIESIAFLAPRDPSATLKVL